MFTNLVSDCIVNSGMLFEVEELAWLWDSGRDLLSSWFDSGYSDMTVFLLISSLKIFIRNR